MPRTSTTNGPYAHAFAKRFADMRERLAPFLGRAAPGDIRRARALVLALGNLGLVEDTLPEQELLLCEAIATHVADDRARLADAARAKVEAKAKKRSASPARGKAVNKRTRKAR